MKTVLMFVILVAGSVMAATITEEEESLLRALMQEADTGEELTGEDMVAEEMEDDDEDYLAKEMDDDDDEDYLVREMGEEDDEDYLAREMGEEDDMTEADLQGKLVKPALTRLGRRWFPRPRLPRPVRPPRTPSTEEILAQAMCQFSASTEGNGRVFAVGRSCHTGTRAKTCTEICKDSRLRRQDWQTKRDSWSCVAAYHVYRGRRGTNLNGDVGTARLGLKSAKTSCDRPSCGPNFCCCFASKLGYIE